MRPARGVLCVLLVLTGCELGRSRLPPPFGFTRTSAGPQRALEERLLAAPDPSRIRDAHRELTRSPHPAGSTRNRELAGWIARQFTDAGMQDVQIVRHDVLLPEPREVEVELVSPRTWRVPLREDPDPSDPDTATDAPLLPVHAFSASGDIRASLVYAGAGAPQHYDWLADRGIDVRGRIVLVRSASPRTYRGLLAYTAERRGAAGILMYPDAAAGDSPAGPQAGAARRDSRIERGSIVYDVTAPGDPLTPGWASVPGAPRLERSKAASIPKIVSVGISPATAGELLQSLGGGAAPGWWDETAARRVGPGPATVRMRVRVDESIRPVWTVTGRFPGTSPEVVILGNHRDAWAYGGVDPSSGSAALVELARVFGGLARRGWRPRRSILFASWDGEEQGLMSSTEWGEQHEEWLSARAVAYFNVDSAVSGRRFTAAGHATLGRLLMEVAEVVRDPVAGVPLATLARDHARSERRQDQVKSQAAVFDDRLGGGSDYTVFANYLGIPVADLAFDGPYPVYHTLYDTHRWVAEKVDRGFVYHAAFVKILGLAVLRLAQADALPLDLAASAAQIAEHVRAASSEWQQIADDRTVAEMDRAADALVAAAASFDESRMRALVRQDPSALADVNARALRFERAFIDRKGLPERPWYRHLVHAPHFSYAPEMLPGIEAAVRQQDRRLFEQEAMRVVAALQRAAASLREGRPQIASKRMGDVPRR